MGDRRATNADVLRREEPSSKRASGRSESMRAIPTSPEKEKEKTLSPNTLRQLAKKAEGLPPGEGMEAIMKEIEKKNLPIPSTVAQMQKSPVKQTSTSSSKSSLSTNSKRTQTTTHTTKSKPRIETEKEKEKKAKFNARRMKESSDTDDTLNLQGIPVSKPEEDELLAPKHHFGFDEFRFLHSLATKMRAGQDEHIHQPEPEIIFLGVTGAGKSELIEAFMGEPFNVVGFRELGRTKRPLILHLVSNENCDKGKYTIINKDQEKKVVVSGSSSPANVNVNSPKVVAPSLTASGVAIELSKNNSESATFSSEPIHIQYESKYCINMRIIDVPGLPPSASPDEISPILTFLEEAVRPSHRLLVCVEDATLVAFEHNDLTSNGGELNTSTQLSFPGRQSIRRIVKRADPGGLRTVFVYNKLHSVIETFTSSAQLQRFLSHCVEPVGKTFWTTLLASRERDNTLTKGSFLERLIQVEVREKRLLGTLQCASSFEPQMGLDHLRDHLIRWVWKCYQTEEITQVEKLLQEKQDNVQDQIKQVDQLMGNLNLKELSAKYASQYLQLAQSLLIGTSKGNPALTGETLKEEIDEQYFSSSEWKVRDVAQAIPFPNTKLYGGQQFERLFAEFNAITSQLTLQATQKRGLPSVTDKQFFYNACEVAQNRSEDVMIPLIQQLIERATFIMKRVPTIVENMLNNKDTLPKHKMPISAKHFGALSASIRDLFNTFVDKTVEGCKSQCMEEFYPTKTLLWEVLNTNEKGATPIQDLSEGPQMADEIFHRVRDRIVRNVIRKVYNFFLVPFMNSALWNDVQTHLSCLDQFSLEEIFDAKSITHELERQKETLEQSLKSLEENSTKLKGLKF